LTVGAGSNSYKERWYFKENLCYGMKW